MILPKRKWIYIKRERKRRNKFKEKRPKEEKKKRKEKGQKHSKPNFPQTALGSKFGELHTSWWKTHEQR